MALTSTTVDGSPISSPASIARSTAARVRSSIPSKLLGGASPLRLALVWRIGVIAPASGPSISLTPSRSRSARQASG